MAPEVVVERDGGIVRVTLNRPERKNALTLAMVEELAGLLDETTRRRDDRVVVLAGAGDAFCSGADLTDPATVAGAAADGPAGWLAHLRRMFALPLALHHCSKPTVAAVRGVAAGAGCNLALGCDLVVAADDARFCQIFVRRGLTVDFAGSWILPRLVGMARAKELALLGDMVPAARAEAIGLVHRVVPSGELERAVAEVAGRLAAGPPVALERIKDGLQRAASLTLAEAVELEALSQATCLSSADAAEGMRAFVERREPRFEGR